MAGRVTHAMIGSNPAADEGTVPPLHVVAVLPPPLNGMTHVTSQMVAALTEAGPVRLSRVSNDGDFRRPLWVFKRHAAFLGALLANAFTGRGRGACYFVPNSDIGLWLNLLEAPLLRMGYREVWLHHHVFSYMRKRDRRVVWFLGMIGAKARHVALGDAMATRLREIYGATEIRVLGNAAFVTDTPEPRTRPVLRTCGFLSNITRAKGIGLFMETIRKLEADGNEIGARIAGPVADPALKAEIDAFVAEAPARRVALGPVRGAAKQAFFDEIDVLLFPSLYANEALPVTIYEGLAAGIPVLATRRGCIPDQLAGLGWALPEESFVADAAAAIRAWRDDPEAYAAASQAAEARFEAERRGDAERLDALVEEMTAR